MLDFRQPGGESIGFSCFHFLLVEAQTFSNISFQTARSVCVNNPARVAQRL